jgi:NAD(P)-dependent dehydrogenase (short-subunit alcohol dehydrogenase family)
MQLHDIAARLFKIRDACALDPAMLNRPADFSSRLLCLPHGTDRPQKAMVCPTVRPRILGYMADENRPTVIVTGGGRGIGAATAIALGAAGYNVAVNFMANQAAAARVVDQLAVLGSRAAAIRGDVSRESDVLRLFEAAERTLGPVRALVNNAGVTGGFARVDSVENTVIAQVLAVNVAGTILCAREAVKRMSTRHGGSGGAIVNISSLVTRTGGAGEWVHYAASKGAVNSFTVGLAREVAAENIRVNAVAPGLIDTELHAANGAPDRIERLSPSIPMQRPGTADEVAAGVVWLLSDAASYVNGAILEIGGGR